MAETAYFNVYASQAGSSLTVVLDREQADLLYDAVHRTGAAVGVWITRPGTTTGIILVPRQGGVVLNMEQAQSIPIDAQGNVVTTEEQQIAKHVEPKDQFPGKVVAVEWSTELADFRDSLDRFGEHLDALRDDIAEARRDEDNGTPEQPPAPVQPPAPIGLDVDLANVDLVVSPEDPADPVEQPPGPAPAPTV